MDFERSKRVAVLQDRSESSYRPIEDCREVETAAASSEGSGS